MNISKPKTVNIFLSLIILGTISCTSSRKNAEYEYLMSKKRNSEKKEAKPEKNVEPEIYSEVPNEKNKTHKESGDLGAGSSSDESLLEEKSRTKALIKKAESFMGTPYLYGGVSKKGMDCSGLMYVSFQEIDRQIPRSSRFQATIGKAVKKSELKPGDLVFFSTNGTGRINHVGLVVKVKEGDVQFIHATTSQGVRKDYLSHSYWKPRYIKAVKP